MTSTERIGSVVELMQELMLQAERSLVFDRRTQLRVPLFRAVTVRFNGQSFSGFTREVSLSSIGLLHKFELPLQEIVLVFDDQEQELRVQINRCEPCGDGWFTSGGDVVDADAYC